MTRFVRLLIAACAMLLCPNLVNAELGIRDQFRTSSPTVQAPQGGYQWMTREDTPGQVFLYNDNTQVGTYSYTSGFYWPIIGNQWGAATTSPIPPPLSKYGMTEQGTNFGVDHTKLTGHERYMVGAEDVKAFEARAALNGNFRDDSKDPHVTAIVKDAATKKRIEADWGLMATQEMSAKNVRWQAYDASAPVNQLILAPFKLELDDAFQRAGIMLVGQAAQQGGEESVTARRQYGYPNPAELVEFVRKTDPKYVPNAPAIPGLPNIGNITLECAACGGILAVLALMIVRKLKN